MSQKATRKGRIANKNNDRIKEIETRVWADSKLSRADKIRTILKELQALPFESPVLDHALIKWEDKLYRLEAPE